MCVTLPNSDLTGLQVSSEIKEKGGIGNTLQNVCAHVMCINTRPVEE